MRYAVFSDIHGNYEAWKHVLADILSLEADVMVCLGDVVGYGPEPEEVLSDIRKYTDNFVLGNHDAAAAGVLDASIFNDDARAALEWTRDHLSRKSIAFLKAVPLSLESEDILFVHAEIEKPGRFDYITTASEAATNLSRNEHFLTFVGHTHLPVVFELNEYTESARQMPDKDCRLFPNRRYLVNVGSVGEPRTPEDFRARYVIYDSKTRDIFFRRIEFDIEAYRSRLNATTLHIKPYFLQAADHKAANSQLPAQDSATRDMKVPAASENYLQNYERSSEPYQLRVPEEMSADARPKPVPTSSERGVHPGMATLISLVVLLLVAGGAWAVLHFQEQEESAKDQAQHPDSTGGGEEGSTGTTPGTHGNPEVEHNSTDNNVHVEPPDKPPAHSTEGNPADPPVVTESQPPPKPVPETGQTPVLPDSGGSGPEVLAHWPMDESSLKGDLIDVQAGHFLECLRPARRIANLAPDPVPRTGERNPSALTLGVWSEAEPSGNFELSKSRSFTFESWIMTNREQAPILVAGTHSGDGESGPGWRLNMRAAPNAASEGKIQFLYHNREKEFSAVSEEIDFFEPTSHHIAAVWNHTGAGPDKGTMLVYYNGTEVARAVLPHDEIRDPAPHPFRLGSRANPPRVALDEVRITAAALRPLDFLTGNREVKPVLLIDASRPATWKHLVPAAPESVPTLAGQLNGQPTLKFDGNDFLAGPPVLEEGDDSFTLLVLWKPDRLGVQTIVEQAGLGNGRRASLHQFYGSYGFSGQNNDARELAPVGDAGTWHLTAMIVHGNESGDITLVDRAASDDPFSGTIDSELQHVGIDGIRVGRSLHGREFFQGEIAEIRFFDSALPLATLEDERQRVQERWKLEEQTSDPGGGVE